MHSIVFNPLNLAIAAFALYFPKVYQKYEADLSAVFNDQPELVHNFARSVYPSATFNLGPETICRLHKDMMNLWCGICCIWNWGTFDWRKGGKLILLEYGLVITFPPGTFFLIPSASVTHANTAISKGETRVSFTQFAAGGLFRWKDSKLMKLNDLRRHDHEHYNKLNSAKAKKERFDNGLALFSKVENLNKDRMAFLRRNLP